MGVSFRTEVNIKPHNFDINYQTPCLIIGSCFSDHIGSILNRLKFPVLQNPFGILYNPSSIAQVLKLTLNNYKISKDDLIQHNNLWHSFLFHGSFSDIDIDRVIEKTNNAFIETNKYLQSASYLIITFGTAWVYKYKANQATVSNCHKIPSTNFNRHQLSVDEIKSEWNKLIKLLNIHNPNLKIIFTVSPIRHLKDGAHENQISKSTLFLSIDSIIKETNFNNIFYFPSYEIVCDELRDYRFNADDMNHISEKAIQYIFEKFKKSFFTDETNEISEKVYEICLAYEHRILNKNNEELKKFSNSMINKINLIEKKYPFVKLLLEKKYFENL